MQRINRDCVTMTNESQIKKIFFFLTEYLCHVYVRNDCLGGVVIADNEYPSRVCFTLLDKVGLSGNKWFSVLFGMLRSACKVFCRLSIQLASGVKWIRIPHTLYTLWPHQRNRLTVSNKDQCPFYAVNQPTVRIRCNKSSSGFVFIHPLYTWCTFVAGVGGIRPASEQHRLALRITNYYSVHCLRQLPGQVSGEKDTRHLQQFHSHLPLKENPDHLILKEMICYMA